MELTADVNVEDLIREYPQAAGYLAERGIVCIRCGEPYWGTLRELAGHKNLRDQIDLIVQELNLYLEQTP